MSECDLCQKESGKQAEQRIGVSFNHKTEEETYHPYNMPVYCDGCEADMRARDEDAKDIEKIKREWYNYRHAGDETLPDVLH